MPAITLSQLGWSAPDGTPVLSGLDFRFAPERIGLIGRNGVGKSTLLALIAGASAPTSGQVSVPGTIAMLRQSPEPAPGQTIADLFDARAALALLDRAEAGVATMDELERCDWTLPGAIADALAQLDLTTPPDTPLTHLSGGQRSRAALAAAIFARPDWLLLDEPTNHLDADGRDALIAMLDCWRGGAIVVSHDRALLDRMDAIAELTSHGIARYGGNWSAYQARKAIEQAAAQQAIDLAERHASDLARKTQIATERQQRRDGAGARQGAKGGIPRILLGRRKQQAEQSRGTPPAAPSSNARRRRTPWRRRAAGSTSMIRSASPCPPPMCRPAASS
ncbi:ATP-binding cassette domain-containing protein [Sphingobium sp. HWE2-09]|uniref:ATP-binding cassette domain-containing protein n=1 Tax=Sphingobium sp. HWE2-09 TaxID=3108390 RepID=UPI002DC2D2AD|nr:ATP-binding cassette domain-containing protein [Sphingobium sp. HWE2-09]